MATIRKTTTSKVVNTSDYSNKKNDGIIYRHFSIYYAVVFKRLTLR